MEFNGTMRTPKLATNFQSTSSNTNYAYNDTIPASCKLMELMLACLALLRLLLQGAIKNCQQRYLAMAHTRNMGGKLL